MNDQHDHGNVPSSAWASRVHALTVSPTAAARPTKRKGPRLRQLEHDLRGICRRNPQGSHATQTDTLRTLLLCATQLFDLGIYRLRAVNLNEKHVFMLVHGWHAQTLSESTIANRLAYLRWLSRKIGKPHLLAPSNCAYGIGGQR